MCLIGSSSRVLFASLMSIQPEISNQDREGENYTSCVIPFDWMARAAALPGKSFHVAIMLWLMAAKENTTNVQLSNKLLQKFSVDRNAKYRALGWLEDAGLISVRRKVGQTPIVTLLDMMQMK